MINNPSAVAIGALAAFAMALALLVPIPGAVTTQAYAQETIVACAFWITMGILSSVGLGSGLHTFLLYTGPHIIRVATAAVACNSLDFSARISSFGIELKYEDDAFDCPPGDP